MHTISHINPWLSAAWCVYTRGVCCHVLQVVSFLSSCQHPQGGYGGGPGQMAHLAPTYAAVGALVTLGGEEALASIDRWGLAHSGDE